MFQKSYLISHDTYNNINVSHQYLYMVFRAQRNLMKNALFRYDELEINVFNQNTNCN